MLKRRPILVALLACALFAVPVQASSRAIVRIGSNLNQLNSICALLGCTVTESIGDPLDQVFLVSSNFLDVSTLIADLLAVAGVIDCEPDQLANTSGSGYTTPPALTDTAPITYYGVTVPEGYVNQPATQIVRLSYAQSELSASGGGIVAIIDTGVDANHPALSQVLLPGYDFTRNRSGADETADAVFPESPASGPPTSVNSMAVANVSQSTAAVVDGPPGYADFGHGTMVAGIVHLVAPTAKILPLKAFSADGTGYISDILRAIYAAVNENAQVVNMSFSFSSYSQEVKLALEYANLHQVTCVAAVGNSGEEITVYPAGYTNLVMGVASTTNTDQRSTFSNYGPVVWVAAPGEGIVTTYPFGFYAAGWGTSFSTPFVSGTAALLVQMSWLSDEYNASGAISHAVPLGWELGNGRLDVYEAGEAWAEELGN